MSSWPSWGNVASLDITLPWPTSSTTSLASVNPSPLPEQPPWLSLQFRTLVLGSVVPTVVVLSILAYDVISAIELPKMLTTFLWLIASPFTNFLNLDDLEDDAGVTYTPRIWKDRILAISSALQAVAWAAFFCYIELVGEHGSGRGVEAGVGFVSWSYALLRVLSKPPRTPPYALLFLFLVHALAALIDLLALGFEAEFNLWAIIPNVVRLTLPLAISWVAGTFPLEVTLPSRKVAKRADIPSNELTMPEDDVNLWSWSTFSFVEPIFKVSNSRTLNETDVWALSPYFTHKNLFNKYLEYCNEYPTHSLIRFLLVSNSLDLILDVTLEMWSAVVGFVPPYALQQILAALADPSPDAKLKAYMFTVLMFLANLSFAQVDLNQKWFSRRCYERTRGQLFCALHYKALKRRDISGKVKKGKGSDEEESEGADLGKVVNLMQGDAYAVAHRFWQFSSVFSAPVRLTIAMVFLYRILGWSSLAGVVVVLVAYVLNYPLGKYNVYITRQSWKAKDKRMSLVNELFQNIRFLKYYGWETRWSNRVRESREEELRWRVKENIVDTLITFIWSWMPSATALSSFLCYTLIAGEKLTVSTAFTAVSLFSYLQGPMTELPAQIFALLHAYVSMKRIDEFLSEPEVEDWACSLKSAANINQGERSKIGFENASFEWGGAPKSETSRFSLGPLNVEFPEGKLTLISGATGSGKSALLAALLGEMHCLSGRVLFNKGGHQVAYCSQNPWLEHATIRDNIIFGAKYGYDEDRYDAVVHACALTRDLDIFEAGDMTEIGEKGITLSGGQRARVALARALYSQATCILLDDPLAAVDMHTAQHITKYALSGDLVDNRTIILVTHHISLCLPIATNLIELSHGTIIRHGTIQELESQGQLKQLVETEDVVEEIQSDPAVMPATNEADVGNNDSVPRKSQTGNGKLVDAEARAEGRVALSTYLTYIKATGTWSWILMVAFMISARLIDIGNQFYLARWGEAYETEGGISSVFVTTTQWFWERLPSPNVDVKPWLLIYFYISMTGAFSILGIIALGYFASLQASRVLFRTMLVSLSGAPSRFYDVTPIGRILNRFTTDINCVDGALLNSVRSALRGVFNFVASITVIVWIVPSFAPFAAFIAWLYIRLAPSYVQASRDLRRLESISLSPAFAGFDELLRGLPHVRAFGMETRYQNRFYQRVDKFQSFDHVYWLVANWLMWRYDCLGSLIVFLSTLFAITSGVKDSFAALVIVQAGVFAEASRRLVSVLAQLELDANSVERIVEYLGVPQEAPAIITSNRPPAYWPSSNGELSVQDLVVKYAPNLPPVLHGISFTVKPTEKIGVVGRTGSGKSTLALSLLRMVEASSGNIIIDGIDISTIGLDDLRTRVTIISQDVSLFTGTIRTNIDPFGEHNDQECQDVLERCHLSGSQHGKRIPITLDTPISQLGSLSAGERQLVALARALLRRSNVVILDEATSQIDAELDDQIQQTVRDEFNGAIVITIAHRLKTVLDYDRILVLGGGEILEFDTPQSLIRKQGGVFRQMCKASSDWPLLQRLVQAGNVTEGGSS